MIDSRIRIHLLHDGTGAATAEEYTVHCIPAVGIPHQSEKTKRKKDNNSSNNSNNNYQIASIYMQAVDHRGASTLIATSRSFLWSRTAGRCRQDNRG